MLCAQCESKRWPGNVRLSAKPPPELDLNISMNQSIIFTPPRLTVPHLTTPVPATVPMPPETVPANLQVTASKIECTENCILESTDTNKVKSIECAMCQEQFHRICVGIKGRVTLWMCSSCKDIPRTLKSLVHQCKSQERTIAQLKQKNHELAELITKQGTEIARLHEQKVTTPESVSHPTIPKRDVTACIDKVVKPPASEDCAYTTLVIGDSMIKDIHENGLDKTKVKCIRGARISTIEEQVLKENPKDYETVIIHVGTNDCSNNKDAENAAKCYDHMIKSVREAAPDTNVLISTVCPRTDNTAHQARVENLNADIKTIGNKYSCQIVDNDACMKMKNDEADCSSLNRSGLHLSKSGTRKLLRNINTSCSIIKKSQKSTSDTSVSQRLPKNSTNANNSIHRGGSRQHSNNKDTHEKRGCYFCGEQNHQKKDCKHGKPITCFSCGKHGHKQHMNLCK